MTNKDGVLPRGWHKSDGEIAVAISLSLSLSIPNFRYLSLIFSIQSLLSSFLCSSVLIRFLSRFILLARIRQFAPSASCTLYAPFFSLPAHFSDTIFAIFSLSLPFSLSLSLSPFWFFLPFLLERGCSRKTRLILLTLRARLKRRNTLGRA